MSQADLLAALLSNNNQGTLHENSASNSTNNITSALVSSFESVLHRCRELHTQERFVTNDRDRLSAELTQASALMRNQQIAAAEELVATQQAARAAAQALRDANTVNTERWKTENETSKSVVETAIERYETVLEQRQLRSAYEAARQQERDLEAKLNDAKELLETQHNDLRLVSTQLEALRSEHAERNFESQEAQQRSAKKSNKIDSWWKNCRMSNESGNNWCKWAC